MGTKVYLNRGYDYQEIEVADPWLVSGKRKKLVPVRNGKEELIERVEVGTGGKVSIPADGHTKEFDIINGAVDASGKDSSYTATGDLAGKIVNGAGVDKGALVAEQNIKLDNSIVNGYAHALYLADGAAVNANDTTFNANGFRVNRNINPLAVRGDALIWARAKTRLTWAAPTTQAALTAANGKPLRERLW